MPEPEKTTTGHTLLRRLQQSEEGIVTNPTNEALGGNEGDEAMMTIQELEEGLESNNVVAAPTDEAFQLSLQQIEAQSKPAPTPLRQSPAQSPPVSPARKSGKGGTKAKKKGKKGGRRGEDAALALAPQECLVIAEAVEGEEKKIRELRNSKRDSKDVEDKSKMGSAKSVETMNKETVVDMELVVEKLPEATMEPVVCTPAPPSVTGVVLGHEVGQKFDNREGTLGKLGYRACTLTRGVRR